MARLPIARCAWMCVIMTNVPVSNRQWWAQ